VTAPGAPSALAAWLQGFVNEPSFINTYGYYAWVLGRMDPLEDPSVPVMAVSARGERWCLHVNTEFFVRAPQYLRGVLLHEVHHVVLGHLGDPTLRALVHQDLLEIAMEVSANEHITEALPGEPCRWTDYRALGLREGQSTRERYDLLVAARDRGEEPLKARRWLLEPSGVGSFPSPWASGLDPHGLPKVAAVLREAVASLTRVGPQGSPSGRLAGKNPGKLLESLEGALEPPKVPLDWRVALTLFVARMRAPVHTFARPSRRAPSRVGVLPGRRWTMVEGERPRLLVAVDTSGSMSSEELSEIARQLRVLGSLARITVCECDAVIHRVYPFEGAVTELAGRGGTDLRPVFEPAFLQAHRPDGVVYFTDGEGPYPPTPPGVRTLWVLTRGEPFGCPWGERVALRAPGGDEAVV
jgi:predicted metal-dependent peptidase